MSDPRPVITALKRRLNLVLTVAEAALPESQFRAFRKLVLDEFGHKGLESEIIDLLRDR